MQGPTRHDHPADPRPHAVVAGGLPDSEKGELVDPTPGASIGAVPDNLPPLPVDGPRMTATDARGSRPAGAGRASTSSADGRLDLDGPAKAVSADASHSDARYSDASQTEASHADAGPADASHTDAGYDEGRPAKASHTDASLDHVSPDGAIAGNNGLASAVSLDAGADGVSLDRGALGRLMPLHLVLSGSGKVLSFGPTIGKLVAGPLAGRPFLDAFAIRRPGHVRTVADLRAHAGQRLFLVQADAPHQAFRGLVVPAGKGGRLLVNLSFGIGVVDAVASHRLTDSDFAPTDLAIELLYLVEAKQLIMGELNALNRRLEGAKKTAEEQALTDTLTGLRNRRALELAFARNASQGTPFALLHIDLDFFKAVNDSLGHAAGDHVLREVAHVLTLQTRKDDTVARVGGDEFVVLYAGDIGPDALGRIANRIVERLSEPVDFEGAPCRVSASIGIVMSQDYARPDLEQMLGDADQALYASKKAGRRQARMFRGDAVTPSPEAEARRPE